MPNVQRNLRVPEEHTDIIHDVAKRLREDHGFAERLRALLDDVEAGSSADVRERLDALEHEVAALKEGQPPARKPARSRRAQGELEPSPDDVVSADPETGAPWVIRHNYKSKITEAGEAEMWRRIREGHSVSSIARALGVGAPSVSRRRKAGLQDE